MEYDSSQKTLDLFGNNVTDSNQDINAAVAQSALDEATKAISQLVRRVRGSGRVTASRCRHRAHASTSPAVQS